MHAITRSLRALKKDPKFAPLIKRHGAPDLARYFSKEHRIFHALLRSIIYQQLSGKAAGTIHGRVLDLFPKRTPTPQSLQKMSPKKLRAAGLSVAKVSYVKDLAKKFLDGTVNEQQFDSMTSQEVIDHLVQIKGVGVWTAQMLLIFTLHRPDILPTGDLGIQKGFQIVYKLRSLPKPKKMEQLAKEWRESATAASWYLWRAVDDFRGERIDRGA